MEKLKLPMEEENLSNDKEEKLSNDKEEKLSNDKEENLSNDKEENLSNDKEENLGNDKEENLSNDKEEENLSNDKEEKNLSNDKEEEAVTPSSNPGNFRSTRSGPVTPSSIPGNFRTTRSVTGTPSIDPDIVRITRSRSASIASASGEVKLSPGGNAKDKQDSDGGRSNKEEENLSNDKEEAGEAADDEMEVDEEDSSSSDSNSSRSSPPRDVRSELAEIVQQRAMMAERLRVIESQIYLAEGEFLRSTQQSGNIFQGFNMEYFRGYDAASTSYSPPRASVATYSSQAKTSASGRPQRVKKSLPGKEIGNTGKGEKDKVEVGVKRKFKDSDRLLSWSSVTTMKKDKDKPKNVAKSSGEVKVKKNGDSGSIMTPVLAPLSDSGNHRRTRSNTPSIDPSNHRRTRSGTPSIDSINHRRSRRGSIMTPSSYPDNHRRTRSRRGTPSSQPINHRRSSRSGGSVMAPVQSPSSSPGVFRSTRSGPVTPSSKPGNFRSVSGTPSIDPENFRSTQSGPVTPSSNLGNFRSTRSMNGTPSIDLDIIRITRSRSASISSASGKVKPSPTRGDAKDKQNSDGGGDDGGATASASKRSRPISPDAKSVFSSTLAQIKIKTPDSPDIAAFQPSNDKDSSEARPQRNRAPPTRFSPSPAHRQSSARRSIRSRINDTQVQVKEEQID